MVRERNPLETRKKILEAALLEVRQGGFNGVSVDRILETTGVTKAPSTTTSKAKASSVMRLLTR